MRRACIASAFVLALTGVLLYELARNIEAASHTVLISGIIRDSAGRPVDGVSVTVKRGDKVVGSDTSKSGGKYKVTGWLSKDPLDTIAYQWTGYRTDYVLSVSGRGGHTINKVLLKRNEAKTYDQAVHAHVCTQVRYLYGGMSVKEARDAMAQLRETSGQFRTVSAKLSELQWR